MARPAKITQFVLDVDGVFTTGQFLYTRAGKYAKVFGPHDADGIKLLRPYLQIMAISADKRGFKITEKRIKNDMGLALQMVAEPDRLSFFREKLDPARTVYMGDGMYDAAVLKLVAYGIAPANAWPATKNAANYVTKLSAGEGAVAEACIHLLTKFFPGVKLPTKLV